MASGSLPPGTLKGLGPELNFEEVRKFVEGASSSCLRLLVDDDDETVQTNGHPSASSKPARTRKGRYLVAKRAIKVGELGCLATELSHIWGRRWCNSISTRSYKKRHFFVLLAIAFSESSDQTGSSIVIVCDMRNNAILPCRAVKWARYLGPQLDMCSTFRAERCKRLEAAERNWVAHRRLWFSRTSLRFRLLVFKSLYVSALLSGCKAFVLSHRDYALFDSRIAGKLRKLLKGTACAKDVAPDGSVKYYGTPAGSYNSKVFNEEFLALMDDDSWEEELGDDELHPCSPLIDCVAGLLLSKRKALTHEDEELRALAAERVRQFWSLVRTSISESVPADAASEIFKVLKEEFQKIVSVEELHAALHTIACNRFGGGETDLDMMYAGSMFEHSCTPNIFLSTWQAGKSDGRHHYRALRDIPEGEALSIDYLLLPDGYLPTPDRAEILGRWGFVCSCARCTSLPDLSRTFVCPHCGKPELCPSSPSRRKYPGAIDPDGAAVTGDDTETMVCRSCGRRPTPEALAKADAHEVDLRRRRGEGSPWFGGPARQQDDSVDDLPAVPIGGDGTLGDCHYAVFGYAWGCMRTGPQEIEDLQDYATAIEALLRCLSRFYDTDCHPQLLSLYHTMGALTANDIEVQKKWLGLERRCLERYYPEECEKQDDEIMRMCQGRGGPQGEEDKNAQNGTEVSPSEKERATLAPPTEPELPPAVADLRAGRWPQSIPKKQDVAAAAVHNFQPPPRGVITGPEDAIGMDSMD
eukprot:TRINITY_DN17270_c0_g2_i1.p1 TRINITY_DN17270_c0_g2~~TRINITY_DN17270_c0_g2_i1.p1  ORF type:complete len:754 (-),score=108.68 TRINITY_DN17270_c0_g2_i1:230-2491(-)